MTLLWTATLGLVLLWVLREIALLVCYAVLLAYALSPLVSALARARYARGRSLPRWAAAAIVVLTLVALAGWLVAFTFPRLVTEAGRLAAEAPGTAAGFVGDAQRFGQAHGMSTWFDPMLEQARVMSAGALKNLGGTIVQWIGHFLGGVGHLLALALLPLLSFYILAEAEAVEASVTRFLPPDARPDFRNIGHAVDLALRAYVRGQAIVCLTMGTLVAVALTAFHCPAPVLLGVFVAVAELVPYAGFVLAALAILITGSSVSPFLATAGLGSYVVINWLVGTFITPRVMGRYLRMHPFVATVSVLAGARLLGPAGSVLALPAVAVVQSLVERLGPLAPRPEPKSSSPPVARPPVT